uniref:G_PROTEIN_RECEP_F1_2 domain-containing protein n=1 Tax=Haemonchus contortus TaxID=6289 RepID=A0A7I4YY35_HAECO
MNVETALYGTNVAFNTVVIAMDIAVMLIAIKTGEIGRQLFLWMIFLCMSMDIAAYLNTVIHDVPSFIMDTDIFKTPEPAYVSVLIILCQWFSQLFALLALSVLHFIAIFSPAKFRSILPRHMWITNFFIIVIGILLTVPMFTPYCGFSYVTEGHVWMYDTSKPYTYVWRVCNFVLQGVCVVVVACVGAVIIWKIRTIRTVVTLRNNTVPSSRANVVLETRGNREKRANREKRLALNFVFLSACFLFQTIVYNLPFRDLFWYKFVIKFAANLNLSKWAIYTLENAKIRHGLLHLCRRRRIESSTTSSVVTVSQAR